MNEATCRGIVNERCQRRCEGCTRFGVEHHHRLNRSQGGKWIPGNIAALCSSCHRYVTEHPKEAWEIGFHVRPWEDYREIPILLHGTHWVRLTDEIPGYDYLDDKENS